MSEAGESVTLVEGCCFLIDGVHNHGINSDFVANRQCSFYRIRQEQFANSLTLCGNTGRPRPSACLSSEGFMNIRDPGPRNPTGLIVRYEFSGSTASGQRCLLWITATICTRSDSMAYTSKYGVFLTTHSRVPSMRPDRPIHGWVSSR